MRQMSPVRLAAGSAAVALAGAIVTVVFFFQPWRGCDYEDTSVGCAMLPADATVMSAAAIVTLAAIVVLVHALLRIRDRPAAE